ncbi:MAG TPA: glutamine-hydrolyzing carbamoyl-phosphate synthase small subunit [Acidobacteriota bacterium]|jgi:carbamoyl-phosphate synthase small subunit|nr:glutamine-hydrolyzing carbamoyl-phosphate synthase small subunit [Acidobacteriota bacterium]
MKRQAILALEDGNTFTGTGFGHGGDAGGEVVFNTSMTGYQEVLTDPSYAGQIVVMTYPLIGNYGTNSEDVESERPHVSAFVVKENSTIYSSWRASESLDHYLERFGIPGIAGIDTRRLVRHIRDAGAQRGFVSSQLISPAEAVAKARAVTPMEGCDLASGVSCRVPYSWPVAEGASPRFKVVAYDYGIKQNILRLLSQHGCDVAIVPAHTTAEDTLAMKPDGVFLSNGPGDPQPLDYAIGNIGKLLGRVPIFGICLGHQLLGLALGGRTFKLKFGHRGGNQPVKNLIQKRVEITAHNHGFAVEPDSLNDREIQITHMNLNDQTLEGFRHRHLPVFSVQYHPEASPGPHDSLYLFDDFVSLMKQHKES